MVGRCAARARCRGLFHDVRERGEIVEPQTRRVSLIVCAPRKILVQQLVVIRRVLEPQQQLFDAVEDLPLSVRNASISSASSFNIRSP
jgi:hypothetical protein